MGLRLCNCSLLGWCRFTDEIKTIITKILTSEEVNTLFSFIDDPAIAPSSELPTTVASGQRIGLLQTIRLSLGSPQTVVRRLKGSKGGEFLLTNAENNSLLKWIPERGSAPGPLFLSRNRKPISRYRLDEMMKHYCQLGRHPGGEGSHA